MRSKYRSFPVIALIMTMMVVSCTHNNGDIGELFGQWKLTEIVVDDKIADDYDGSIYWSFQSSTIRMTQIKEHHDRAEVHGSWRLEDNTLILSFPDEGQVPFPQLGLPADCALQVLKITSSTLWVKYTRDDGMGEAIIYKLKKW